MATSREELIEVLAQYPSVSAAFAYGSGVVEQGGYDYSLKDKDSAQLPMLDLIFVVEDSEQWHAENMRRHPDHYSSFLARSPGVVAAVQEKMGAKVWFNAYIPMGTKRSPHRMIKYGVIQREALVRDLLSWDTLYIAGRLQKPVMIIKSNEEIDRAMEVNRKHAVKAAVLLLPKIFSEVDLFLSIASLSYIGDPRMFLGENPRKVINLVMPIVPHYRSMYQSTLSSLLAEPIALPIAGTKEHVIASPDAILRHVTNQPENIYMQEGSREARWSLCTSLPLSMRRLLLLRSRTRIKVLLKDKPPTRTSIRAALASLVARSASSQSLKGLLTVGVVKSAKYLLAKLGKRLFGK